MFILQSKGYFMKKVLIIIILAHFNNFCSDKVSNKKRVSFNPEVTIVEVEGLPNQRTPEDLNFERIKIEVQAALNMPVETPEKVVQKRMALEEKLRELDSEYTMLPEPAEYIKYQLKKLIHQVQGEIEKIINTPVIDASVRTARLMTSFEKNDALREFVKYKNDIAALDNRIAETQEEREKKSLERRKYLLSLRKDMFHRLMMTEDTVEDRKNKLEQLKLINGDLVNTFQALKAQEKNQKDQGLTDQRIIDNFNKRIKFVKETQKIINDHIARLEELTKVNETVFSE